MVQSVPTSLWLHPQKTTAALQISGSLAIVWIFVRSWLCNVLHSAEGSDGWSPMETWKLPFRLSYQLRARFPSDLQRSSTNPRTKWPQVTFHWKQWTRYELGLHMKHHEAVGKQLSGAPFHLQLPECREVPTCCSAEVGRAQYQWLNDSPRYLTLQCLEFRVSMSFLENKVMWKLAFCPNLHGVPVKGLKKVVLLRKRERRSTWALLTWKDFESSSR